MLTDPEKQKLAAALEQLEAEEQRRIDAKIEAGEAIFQPAANVCAESMLVTAHRGNSVEDMTRLRSSVYRSLGLTEPPDLPTPVFYVDCATGND